MLVVVSALLMMCPSTAYRMGQTRDVRVYRLVSAQTIEELMYQRQLYKIQLGNSAIYQSHERRSVRRASLYCVRVVLKSCGAELAIGAVTLTIRTCLGS